MSELGVAFQCACLNTKMTKTHSGKQVVFINDNAKESCPKIEVGQYCVPLSLLRY